MYSDSTWAWTMRCPGTLSACLDGRKNQSFRRRAVSVHLHARTTQFTSLLLVLIQSQHCPSKGFRRTLIKAHIYEKRNAPPMAATFLFIFAVLPGECFIFPARPRAGCSLRGKRLVIALLAAFTSEFHILLSIHGASHSHWPIDTSDLNLGQRNVSQVHGLSLLRFCHP